MGLRAFLARLPRPDVEGLARPLAYVLEPLLSAWREDRDGALRIATPLGPIDLPASMLVRHEGERYVSGDVLATYLSAALVWRFGDRATAGSTAARGR